VPRRLLVTHFVRQLLDNDLISPGADRHHVLSVTAASLITGGIFLTVFFSLKYLFNAVPSPAETALVALDDVCLMSGLSMIVLALVALVAWDRLSLDARDTAILGPLPVRPRHLAMAQLTALAIFAAVFAVALNGVPSALMSIVRVSKLRVSAFSILQIATAQAFATVAAGLLGFVAIVAARETLRLLSGSLWLRGLSTVTQSALLVMTVFALIGLPSVSSQVAHQWVEGDAEGGVPPPPVWFAGLYDWIGGDQLERLPPTMPPPDSPRMGSILEFERRTAVRYSHLRGRLATLGLTAVRALALSTIVALGVWAWNGRRLPQAQPIGRRRRRPVRMELLLARGQVTRAGTQLTMRTIARSTPHRVVAAATVGLAVAFTTVCLRNVALGRILAIADVPLAVMAAQTIVLVTVMAGMWQACRIPASLIATPSFLLAWCGDAAPYVTGVRRTAALGGVVSVLALAPLHLVLCGVHVALWHAMVGVVMVGILSRLFFSDGFRLPLVSIYEPSGNVMGLLPIYLAATTVVIAGIAWVEREGLQTSSSSAIFLFVLVLIWASVVFVSHRRDGAAGPEEFEASSTWETQHLSLSE
jgi:hypothetical protein